MIMKPNKGLIHRYVSFIIDFPKISMKVYYYI